MYNKNAYVTIGVENDAIKLELLKKYLNILELKYECNFNKEDLQNDIKIYLGSEEKWQLYKYKLIPYLDGLYGETEEY